MMKTTLAVSTLLNGLLLVFLIRAVIDGGRDRMPEDVRQTARIGSSGSAVPFSALAPATWDSTDREVLVGESSSDENVVVASGLLNSPNREVLRNVGQNVLDDATRAVIDKMIAREMNRDCWEERGLIPIWELKPGEPSDARVYERYKLTDITNAGALYELGLFAQGLGAMLDARNLFRLALQADPNHYLSREALGQVWDGSKWVRKPEPKATPNQGKRSARESKSKTKE
ncbi:MAG: hypothetical protein AB1486_11255 [Planctomycetota bacterium]